MLNQSKEEHDLVITSLINRTISKEFMRGLNNRERFHSWHEAYGFILEELEEVQEGLEITIRTANALKEAIFKDGANSTFVKEANLLAINAKHLVHEAMQLSAVALKAMVQLDGDHHVE